MVTLKDIAAHVGVSISAVSLVLNERGEGRVRPDVAARIRNVADELGYAPNLLARGLKTNQSHTIGLLSDQVATVPFAGAMLAGAQNAAAAEDFLLIVVDTAGNRDLDSHAVKTLLQRNIEGLILATDFHRDVDLPMVPHTVPIVVLDGRPSDQCATADWVIPDEQQGAFVATQALTRAGHRRIAFCNVGDSRFIARSLRRTGYEEALRAAGIPIDPRLIVEATDPSTAAGREQARDLLRRDDPPTGVFCFSDQIAFGFYQVAQELGLRIPDDLSIVGFDDHPFIADSLLPGLTTVRLPHRDMGTWAARQAIARLRGEEAPGPLSIQMPCPLVERGSVAPPTLTGAAPRS